MNEITLAPLQVPVSIEFPPEAIKARDELLDRCAEIGLVKSDEQNQLASDLAQELYALQKQVEKAAKEARDPATKFSKLVIATEDEFTLPVFEEYNRLMATSGDWVQLGLAKERAAQLAKIEALNEIERRKQEALSQATTIEKHAEINEQASRAAAYAQSATTQPVMADSQRGKWKWRWNVDDPAKLAAFLPSCVKITVKNTELDEKLQLLAGAPGDGRVYSVPGLKAWCEFELRSKLPAKPRPIEVNGHSHELPMDVPIP